MINKIQEYIEDNTSMDITRNQIIIGLSVIIALILLVLVLVFGGGGPKVDDTYVSTPPTNEPAYVGQ